MAIRNLEAINRMAESIARRNEQERVEFKRAVDAFRKQHQNAVDAADTILAIHDKGLQHRYDLWYNLRKFLWDFREVFDSEVTFYAKIERIWSKDEKEVIFVAKDECTHDKPWEIEYSPAKNKVFLSSWCNRCVLDDDTLDEIDNEVGEFTLVFEVMEKGLSVFCKEFFAWIDNDFQ